DAVRDENDDVSWAAKVEVRDTLPEAAIFTLIHEKELVRPKAVRRLRFQSRSSSIEALAGAALDKDVKVSDAATEVQDVQDILPEAAIRTLIGALQDEDSSVRIKAVRVLGVQFTSSSIAEIETAILEALAGAVLDKDADVSEAATKVLEIQATLPEAAIRTLTGALQDENSSIRIKAARALPFHIRSSSIAVEVLVKALREEDRGPQREAFRALCDLKPISFGAVQALIRAFRDKSHIGKGELRVLCHHSRSSPLAASALASIISDRHLSSRYTILDTLGNDIDLPESVVLAVLGVLKDEDRMATIKKSEGVR
ncbi:hypothetical protein BGZ65_012402, partial [Modicella reniformis]